MPLVNLLALCYMGALLRREGLYSSHLTDWRRQRGDRPEGRNRPGWRELAGFA